VASATATLAPLIIWLPLWVLVRTTSELLLLLLGMAEVLVGHVWVRGHASSLTAAVRRLLLETRRELRLLLLVRGHLVVTTLVARRALVEGALELLLLLLGLRP